MKPGDAAKIQGVVRAMKYTCCGVKQAKGIEVMIAVTYSTRSVDQRFRCLDRHSAPDFKDEEYMTPEPTSNVKCFTIFYTRDVVSLRIVAVERSKNAFFISLQINHLLVSQMVSMWPMPGGMTWRSCSIEVRRPSMDKHRFSNN